MNAILVSSHRRSGTHLLIDSIRKHVKGAEFPNHRHLPADFNLGSLFSKDERVFKVFKNFLETDRPIIIKSHLLPEECDLKAPRDKFEALILEIFEQAKKVYVAREGKAVLISLHRFLKSDSNFSDFIREPNDHIVRELRSEAPFDANRVAYWAYHQAAWNGTAEVHTIDFSDLVKRFEPTMESLLAFLEQPVPEHLSLPQVPRIMWLHHLQKKLNHFGLAPLPECSSVRPNKGRDKTSQPVLSAEDEAFFIQFSREFGSGV